MNKILKTDFDTIQVDVVIDIKNWCGYPDAHPRNPEIANAFLKVGKYSFPG